VVFPSAKFKRRLLYTWFIQPADHVRLISHRSTIVFFLASLRCNRAHDSWSKGEGSIPPLGRDFDVLLMGEMDEVEFIRAHPAKRQNVVIATARMDCKFTAGYPQGF